MSDDTAPPNDAQSTARKDLTTNVVLDGCLEGCFTAGCVEGCDCLLTATMLLISTMAAVVFSVAR